MKINFMYGYKEEPGNSGCTHVIQVDITEVLKDDAKKISEFMDDVIKKMGLGNDDRL